MWVAPPPMHCLCSAQPAQRPRPVLTLPLPFGKSPRALSDLFPVGPGRPTERPRGLGLCASGCLPLALSRRGARGSHTAQPRGIGLKRNGDKTRVGGSVLGCWNRKEHVFQRFPFLTKHNGYTFHCKGLVDICSCEYTKVYKTVLWGLGRVICASTKGVLRATFSFILFIPVTVICALRDDLKSLRYQQPEEVKPHRVKKIQGSLLSMKSTGGGTGAGREGSLLPGQEGGTDGTRGTFSSLVSPSMFFWK